MTTTTTAAAAAAVATTGTATEAEAEVTTTEAEATLYAFHDIHAVDDVLVACSVPWNAKHPISMIIIIIYARTPQSSSSYRNTITLTQKRGRERACRRKTQRTPNVPPRKTIPNPYVWDARDR